MNTQTTQQTDERPLEPHRPRTDAQYIQPEDAEKFCYEHQHTRGLGPTQSCVVVDQYDDGYCKVIIGFTAGLQPATVIAWSGCLTKSRELVPQQRELLEMYRKSEKQALRRAAQ